MAQGGGAARCVLRGGAARRLLRVCRSHRAATALHARASLAMGTGESGSHAEAEAKGQVRLLSPCCRLATPPRHSAVARCKEALRQRGGEYAPAP
eukprot:scaffold17867_cov40-Phaeocystis_antarctica.AAC.3